MKISVRLYRVVKMQTGSLRDAADMNKDEPIDNLEGRLREKYGMLSPVVRFFSNDAAVSYAGIECMAFDLEYRGMPIAGLASADPLLRDEILKAEGHLEGELSRLGLYSSNINGHFDFEWRCHYEVNGN